MFGLAANIIIIMLELYGLYISWPVCRWGILALYTQLSNLVTLISSVAFLINRHSDYTITLRYLSTVMLAMTVLVTLSVLIPLGCPFRDMMLSGEGLIHHTLCPAVSITSYFLWEQHSSLWLLPTAVTIVYGIVMLCLNGLRLYDGPYPFLRVHNQSRKASVIWMTALTIFIALLSLAVTAAAR